MWARTRASPIKTAGLGKNLGSETKLDLGQRRLGLICATAWDDLQIARANFQACYEIQRYGVNVERSPGDFNARDFVIRAIRDLTSSGIDGIVGTSDYPGSLVASIIADQLALPGPKPEALLRASHKYYSRIAQRNCVAAATPQFALVDRKSIDEATFPLTFPIFVKPVKGTFSRFARKVYSYRQLKAYVDSPTVANYLTSYTYAFNQCLEMYGLPPDGGLMIAEEILNGLQYTLEAFIFENEMTVLGIVRSFMYVGTNSFERFDYPSDLKPHVSLLMIEIASKVMNELDFDNGVFNIEFFHDPCLDKVYIIEINPRMCPQFADMMENVNGLNTYEIAFSLAVGLRPVASGESTTYAAASSFVLRSFQDAVILHTPDRAKISEIEAMTPPMLVNTFFNAGESLSKDCYQFDGASYRYAVVNMAGPSASKLRSRMDFVKRQLNIVLAGNA